MDITGPLEALGTADVCLRLGQIFSQRYQELRGAQNDVEDLVRRMEKVWPEIESQLATVKRILAEGIGEQPGSSPTFGEQLQEHIEKLLIKLQHSLHTASRNFDKAVKGKGSVNAIRFALFLRGSLEKDVTELEKWKNSFLSTFFMLTIPKDDKIDRILSFELSERPHPAAGNVVAAVKAIRDARQPLPFGVQAAQIWLPPVTLYLHHPIGASGAQVVLDNSTGTGYVMDTMVIDGPRIGDPGVDDDVTSLTRVLKTAQSFSGILACRGVIKREEPKQYEFLFEMPQGLGSTPECLRNLLQKSPQESHPLEERFLLAKQVAKAVMFVHNLNFVHKNIRPDTIIVFPNPGKTLGMPFLVGFQRFRPADGMTYMAGDEAWDKNLYRHPSRQGTLPDAAYRMQHDIYSLGVVLLEIGMWLPFVNEQFGPAGAISHLAPILGEKDLKRKSNWIKKSLIQMAYNNLSQTMGSKYMEVVVNCLTCLDQDGEFRVEGDFLEDDGVLVGVRYIDQILAVLEDIAV